MEFFGLERWLAIFGQVGKKPDGTIHEDTVELLEVTLENFKLDFAAVRRKKSVPVKATFNRV